MELGGTIQSCFTDQDTKAQGEKVTHKRSLLGTGRAGLEPKPSHSEVIVFCLGRNDICSFGSMLPGWKLSYVKIHQSQLCNGVSAP